MNAYTITRNQAAAIEKAVSALWLKDSEEYVLSVNVYYYADDEELCQLDDAKTQLVSISAKRPRPDAAEENAQQDAAYLYCKAAADVLGEKSRSLPWDCLGNGADGDIYSLEFTISD